jgi:hypothetical protein
MYCPVETVKTTSTTIFIRYEAQREAVAIVIYIVTDIMSPPRRCHALKFLHSCIGDHWPLPPFVNAPLQSWNISLLPHFGCL